MVEKQNQPKDKGGTGLKKTKFPAVISTAIVCFIFWLLISGELARIIMGKPSWQIIAAGALVSIGAGLFSARYFVHGSGFRLWNPKRLVMLILYIPVFLWELLKANIDVAVRAFKRLPKNSGIVKVPVGLKNEYAQSMLANSITLTPGTITMDIAEEDGRTYYYIHCIDVTETDPEKAGDAIKGTMEKWIRRIWE
jgi:multicomponent Na+:H+ antiporter subunit E